MAQPSTFQTEDNAPLDIIVTSPNTARACFLLYPSIGGTSRSSLVPHAALTDRGFVVIEYHPPAHGRSRGQMTMPLALQHLYRFLALTGYARLPLVVLGHSAGCNALLHLNRAALDIKWYFLAQPVFSFRESMLYMYRCNTAHEFISAISRWCSDPEQLRHLLPDERWLDLQYWHQSSLRHRIDAISHDMQLGTFLEDFYIPGYDTTSTLRAIATTASVYLSPNDSWYSPDVILEASQAAGIIPVHLPASRNHFLAGAWPDVWQHVNDQLDILETL